MLLVKNKKAFFNYEEIERFIAGVVLFGYEVKAIREKKVSFEGAYVTFDENDELEVVNLQIGSYSKLSQDLSLIKLNRPKRLLLNSHEILQIRRHIKEKGKTVVPVALLLKNGKIKLEIAVVKGLKNFEKREKEKKKQIEKELRINI